MSTGHNVNLSTSSYRSIHPNERRTWCWYNQFPTREISLCHRLMRRCNTVRTPHPNICFALCQKSDIELNVQRENNPLTQIPKDSEGCCMCPSCMQSGLNRKWVSQIYTRVR
jgi:hypothetical protein